MLFAYDIFFFCKVNNKSIQAIHDILLSFSSLSAMQINPSKSKVYFSNTVNHNTIQYFKSNFGQSNDLGIYLGYPLKHAYTKNDFASIIDKLNKKLQGQKSNLLSKTRRTQLINAILSNISTHIMSSFLLPKTTLTKIDNKLRKFLLWT